MTTSTAPALDLESHRRLVWALAYRMTGVAADADDIVQETFARALKSLPPPQAGDARSVRPWLVTVAMNLARDALRRRKRARYVGPWLPSPVGDEQLGVDLEPFAASTDPAKHGEQVRDDVTPEHRYSVRESATFAFLLALEALTPQRRAVLILRDVFDYSTEETARALGMTSDAVKQSLLRARRALASYDAKRAPLAEKNARNEAAMSKLFTALLAGDTAAIEALLADDVEAHADGADEFAAAKIVVRGRAKVALVYANLTKLGMATSFEARMMNGAPAALLTLQGQTAVAVAPRTVMSVETNERGEITRLYSVLATRKLTAV